MKLPDIDDKYKERLLIVMAGRELVARKHPDDDFWLVKTQSCNYCGECCMDHPPTPYGVDDEGKCNKLVKFGDKWECAAGASAPWNCLNDPEDIECCSIRYKKVKAE